MGSVSSAASFAAQLSTDLADATQRAASSVVRVEGRGQGASTGVIVSDGLVVTADHAVERDEIPVVFDDGSAAEGKLAGRDPSLDLAVIKVPSGAGTPANFSAEVPRL